MKEYKYSGEKNVRKNYYQSGVSGYHNVSVYQGGSNGRRKTDTEGIGVGVGTGTGLALKNVYRSKDKY